MPVEAAIVGKLIAGTIGVSAIGISIVTLPFLSPAFRKHCLPYIPATDQQIQNVFETVKRVEKVGRVVDLGSGDGRIVSLIVVLFYIQYSKNLCSLLKYCVNLKNIIKIRNLSTDALST